jgi:Flp pilus assembly protein protease CpaA
MELVLLGMIAIIDAAEHRIPDWSVAALGLVAVVSAVHAQCGSGGAISLGQTEVIKRTMLSVAIQIALHWQRGSGLFVMGQGDYKLLAVLALLHPPGGTAGYFRTSPCLRFILLFPPAPGLSARKT